MGVGAANVTGGTPAAHPDPRIFGPIHTALALGMAIEEVSLSLPTELLAEARRRAHGESLSAYVADGLRRRLRADRQRDYLEEWEAQFGPIPAETIAEIEALWPD